MSISEINKMSVEERLTAMEQIWDSQCHEVVEPESPSWHEEVLNERKKLMDSPDGKYLTIDQLRERYLEQGDSDQTGRRMLSLSNSA